jgi:hypothetical protein
MKGWFYDPSGQRAAGEKMPDHMKGLPFNEIWHRAVVESACAHCHNVMLLPESRVKASGLATGVSLPHLYMYKDGSVLKRVFLEDVMAYTYCTEVTESSADLSPLDLLPHVEIKRDTPSTTAAAAASRSSKARDQTPWETEPSYFRATDITSQSRVHWRPPARFLDDNGKLKRKRKRKSVPKKAKSSPKKKKQRLSA